MRVRIPNVPPKAVAYFAATLVVALGVVFRQAWIPPLNSWVENTIAAFRKAPMEEVAKEARRTLEVTSLKLSAQARRNIGLSDELLRPIRLQTFRRAITVPAMVVGRPGRTQIQVATPMTGVITHVHVVTGETVEAGTVLFKIQLTHEDLVEAQTEFLKTIGSLEVEQQEIARLTKATATGAVAKIKLLERQYSAAKLGALLRAQKEALRLHGLSERQVRQISTGRRLLRELEVVAPYPDRHPEAELRLTQQPVQNASYQSNTKRGQQLSKVPVVLSSLNVHKGQAVTAGETLCVLSDLRELYIEGQAFEQDGSLLEKSAAERWPITAIQPMTKRTPVVIDNLKIAYVDSHVQAQSRALRFYVELPNSVIRETRSPSGQRFVGWKFKPGQRMQLRIPVEEWRKRIVLPVDAVGREGAEFFVFIQNGDHFDRKEVHVEYRDQLNVVIANDGSLFEGDVVALTGAHQMLMALKNDSGAAVDPHAGHNH